MLWVCEGCTARYSVGAPRCPQCGSTEYHEEGSMPKAHRDRPPTYEQAAAEVVVDGVDQGPGEVGEVPAGRPFEPLPEVTDETAGKELVSLPDYDAWDYRELQSEAKERGLVATGTRDELSARLRADDDERGQNAAAEGDEPGGELDQDPV